MAPPRLRPNRPRAPGKLAFCYLSAVLLISALAGSCIPSRQPPRIKLSTDIAIEDAAQNTDVPVSTLHAMLTRLRGGKPRKYSYLRNRNHKFIRYKYPNMREHMDNDLDLDELSPQYQYDLAVIGGGSGGMAAAKEAARLGARVVLFDYVKPSPQGTTWGIGGTCVNVGCIPKKLMHYAGLLGQSVEDAEKLGWNIGTANKTHNWKKMVEAIQRHIKSLNFGYRTALRNAGVEYINSYARINATEGKRDILFRDKATGIHECINASKVLIAVGGRPNIPDIPGKELGITSDDVFTLKEPPGNTLIVGGGYIALETAGFLNELGYRTTVSIRSQPLRGFDRQMVNKTVNLMYELGTNFLYGYEPVKLEKVVDPKPYEGDTDPPKPRVKVTLMNKKNETITREYHTVMFAMGRNPNTGDLGLNTTHLPEQHESGKLYTLPDGRVCSRNASLALSTFPSSTFHINWGMGEAHFKNRFIYAVGDCVYGVPELTPVAIAMGEKFARRMMKHEDDTMEYGWVESFIPTTIFTPIEFGSVGYTEEDAIAKYPPGEIEVYCWDFQTMEHAALHRSRRRYKDEYSKDLGNNCLSKIICVKSQAHRCIGFHFVGPNAGEVTQGFALALIARAKKKDFDRLLGIHPTDAESFASTTGMVKMTKTTGNSYIATGGCGGGKCG